METSKKQTIKNNIKEVVSSNPNKSIVLVFGLMNTTLKYDSKKAFGEMVLSFLDRENVNDIAFKGIENNALKFAVSQEFKTSNFTNDRGYGSGRNMGD